MLTLTTVSHAKNDKICFQWKNLCAGTGNPIQKSQIKTTNQCNDNHKTSLLMGFLLSVFQQSVFQDEKAAVGGCSSLCSLASTP